MYLLKIRTQNLIVRRISENKFELKRFSKSCIRLRLNATTPDVYSLKPRIILLRT